MNTAHIQTQPPAGDGTPTQAPTTPSPKDFATVQAQFAMKGHQLLQGSDRPSGERDYLLNCWGWTRYIDNWPEVLDVLKQIGGKA